MPAPLPSFCSGPQHGWTNYNNSLKAKSEHPNPPGSNLLYIQTTYILRIVATKAANRRGACAANAQRAWKQPARRQVKQQTRPYLPGEPWSRTAHHPASHELEAHANPPYTEKFCGCSFSFVLLGLAMCIHTHGPLSSSVCTFPPLQPAWSNGCILEHLCWPQSCQPSHPPLVPTSSQTDVPMLHQC